MNDVVKPYVAPELLSKEEILELANRISNSSNEFISKLLTHEASLRQELDTINKVRQEAESLRRGIEAVAYRTDSTVEEIQKELQNTLDRVDAFGSVDVAEEIAKLKAELVDAQEKLILKRDNKWSYVLRRKWGDAEDCTINFPDRVAAQWDALTTKAEQLEARCESYEKQEMGVALDCHTHTEQAVGDAGLKALFVLQDAIPNVSIASGIQLGVKIAVDEYLKLKSQLEAKDNAGKFTELDKANARIIQLEDALTVETQERDYYATEASNLRTDNFRLKLNKGTKP